VFAEGSAERGYSDSNAFAGSPEEYRSPFHPETNWHPLHTSRRAYEQGLEYGCELCSLLTGSSLTDSDDFRTSFMFQLGTERRLWIGNHQTPRRGNILEFIIRSPKGSPNITEVHDSAVTASRSLHTGSSEALHLASLWLEECTNRHERCARLSKPTWYPTRLLEVTDDTVRLVVTAEHDSHGPYLTLSHRWGFAPPKLMLTPESAGLLKNGLDIATLEPTFRDALVATRSLGFQHMWIDLFCILQGAADESQRDWARESATMDRVYAGSLLNISAACSHDGTAGCFRPTSALREDPSIVSLWAMYRGDEPRYDELVGSTPHDGLTEFYRTSPMFGRGWIVQERILAPRVLHFADRGMIWECCEGVGTQTQPHIDDRLPIKIPSPLPGELASSDTPRSDLIRLWNSVVLNYSRSTLTMPNKDRLIALQGISKRIAGLLQDTLFFGFLSCRMPYSLCWTSGGPVGAQISLENCAFPSWHFARLNSEVFLHDSACEGDESRDRFERPLLYYFHSPDLDPTLSVVPKYLCCISRTVLLVAEKEFEQSPGLAISFHLDSFTKDSDGRVKVFSPTESYDLHSRVSMIFDRAVPGYNSGKRTWTLLPVGISVHRTSPYHPYSGLVLQQTSHRDFVRQGAFFSYETPGDPDPGVLLKAVEAATPRIIMIA
jgi:hypothetical protein